MKKSSKDMELIKKNNKKDSDINECESEKEFENSDDSGNENYHNIYLIYI